MTDQEIAELAARHIAHAKKVLPPHVIVTETDTNPETDQRTADNTTKLFEEQ